MDDYFPNPTHIQIVKGAIRVNSAHVLYKYDEVALINVDLNSKYAELVSHTSGCGEPPAIVLGANEDTLDFNRDRKDEMTVVEFTDFPGFEVFSVSVSRYTVRVTLIKEQS